jgi:hypothetical protein
MDLQYLVFGLGVKGLFIIYAATLPRIASTIFLVLAISSFE